MTEPHLGLGAPAGPLAQEASREWAGLARRTGGMLAALARTWADWSPASRHSGRQRSQRQVSRAPPGAAGAPLRPLQPQGGRKGPSKGFEVCAGHCSQGSGCGHRGSQEAGQILQKGCRGFCKQASVTLPPPPRLK